MKRYTSECGTQNNDYASEQWGRLYSLRTRWKAGPAGREAGCGQDCPPYDTGGISVALHLVGSTARITAGTLIALDGAQLIDILTHQVLVLRLKRSAVERFFDIFQRTVEIFLGGHFARTAGLR